MGLICFGDVSITVEAVIADSPCDVEFGGFKEPRWFNTAGGFVLLGPDQSFDGLDDCGFWPVLDPSVDLPAGGSSTLYGLPLRVTGVFDHPAARSCTYTYFDGTTLSGPEGSVYCRLAFAITGIEVR